MVACASDERCSQPEPPSPDTGSANNCQSFLVDEWCSQYGRFYAIARGSATESAALLDVLLARKLVTAETHQLARTSLLRIVQMFTRLCVERR